MVGMAVRDIEVTRGGDEVELFGRRIALEPPTAPVHGTDEPWVGGEERPAVFEQDEGGVTQCSEFETKRLEARSRRRGKLQISHCDAS